MVRAGRKNVSGDFENLFGKVLIPLSGDSSTDKQMNDRGISTLLYKFTKSPKRFFCSHGPLRKYFRSVFSARTDHYENIFEAFFGR